MNSERLTCIPLKLRLRSTTTRTIPQRSSAADAAAAQCAAVTAARPSVVQHYIFRRLAELCGTCTQQTTLPALVATTSNTGADTNDQ